MKQTNKKNVVSKVMNFAETLSKVLSPDVSTIYVAKYNLFVDTILNRINDILKEKYNPVTVRLTNPSNGTQNTTASKKSKKKKNSSKKKKSGRKTEKIAVKEVKNLTESSTERIQQQFNEESKVTGTTLNPALNEETVTPTSSSTFALSSTTVPSKLSTRQETNEISGTTSKRDIGASTIAPTSQNKKKKKNKTRTASKSNVATTNNAKTNRKPASSTVNKIPVLTKAPPAKRPRSKAKATLHGLSTLKRSGDVSVIMMSNYTAIRTDFSLGPLVLRVKKEFGKSNRKEIRSATATTAKMFGKLSLRVYHGGAATLHSIHVLQPEQMRIESADNHDKTREYVWKRSSDIAHLVSEKLSSATRSMLRPTPTRKFSPAA